MDATDIHNGDLASNSHKMALPAFCSDLGDHILLLGVKSFDEYLKAKNT